MSYMKREWEKREQERAEKALDKKGFIKQTLLGTDCWLPAQLGNNGGGYQPASSAPTSSPRHSGSTIGDCIEDINLRGEFTLFCPQQGCPGEAEQIRVQGTGWECDSEYSLVKATTRCCLCGKTRSLSWFLAGQLCVGDVVQRTKGWLYGWKSSVTAAAVLTEKELKTYFVNFLDKLADKPTTETRDVDRFLKKQRDDNLRSMFG